MTRTIDLNCDLGESFGAWRMGADDEVLPFVSSANIACGFHAGDPATMRDTVRAALAHGVAIGAHVSLPDLVGFGRREMQVSADEVHAMTLYQLGALAAFARAAGTRLRHVKPHGALYTMAARDAALADAIAGATRAFDAALVLVGLAGSALTDAGRRAGLRVAEEGFVDRRYRDDGALVSRRAPGALIGDVAHAVQQGRTIARERRVVSDSGRDVTVAADTLCIHGDRPGAPAFARALREALEADGWTIRAPGPA